MKYVILAASVMMQLCLGGAYAWSSFVPELESTVHLSVAQTQLIFGGLFGIFTISMVLSGRLLDRFGPRANAITGSLLFGVGYIVASFSAGRMPLMLLGISLFVGVGTGFAYVCPLATCMKWFPERRGLVTGISVAGFGGGAVILSALAERLLSSGMHVLTVFRWIGFVYGIVLLVAAAALRFPRLKGQSCARSALPLRRLLRDPFFLSLAIGMFSGTFAGMLVIGNLKPMALDVGIPAIWAAATISAFAVGNASGRIAWGWFADRIDDRIIPIKLLALGIPLALLAWVDSPIAFIGVSFAVGFGFGACFVVYAAQVASRYGPAHVGGIYPVVFLAYGAAGVAGPTLGGWLYDSISSYDPAIALSCAVVGFGLVGSTLLLRKGRSYSLGLAPLPSRALQAGHENREETGAAHDAHRNGRQPASAIRWDAGTE